MAELRDDYGEDLEDDYAITPEVMRDTDDSTTKSASSEDPDKKIHDAATAAPHVDPDMTELLDDYGESPQIINKYYMYNILYNMFPMAVSLDAQSF